MQLLPSASLKSLVKHYLFLEAKGNYLHHLRLFPDGNPGIVLCEEGKLFINNHPTYQHDLPASFLYGKVEKFEDLICHGSLKLTIIVLQPYVAYRFLDNSLDKTILDLTDILGNTASGLLSTMKATAGIYEKIEVLEPFLMKSFFDILYAIPPVVPATISHVIKKRGLLSVDEMVKFSGYEKRQLERIFNHTTGMTPKRFANLIKLHFFLSDIRKTSTKTKLSQVAYGAGYYDQSHLIREFKKITGLTPSSYFKTRNKLAVNFLQL